MKTKFVKISMLSFLALTVTNCGQSADPGVPPPVVGWGNQCIQQPGTVWNGSQCVPLGGPLTPGTFDQACYQAGGIATTSSYNNIRKCTRQMSNNSALPILNATNPFGGEGLSLGQVRAGDLLEYRFSACWKYCTGWTCSIGFGSCSGINQDGRDNNGVQQSLGSLPQGVIGNDGQESFFLGSGAQSQCRRTMARDGFLRVGINAAQVTLSQAQYVVAVSTCIDANGQSITCPSSMSYCQ
jgi:hypothetical protein